jgi:hypothetical protein
LDEVKGSGFSGIGNRQESKMYLTDTRIAINGQEVREVVIAVATNVRTLRGEERFLTRAALTES